MNPGELRHRITFQKFTTTVIENGFEVEEWVDFKTVWASIKNLHGREYFQAAAVQKKNTVKFMIRYISGIDTSMKILFKNTQYDITSILYCVIVYNISIKVLNGNINEWGS